MSEKKRILVVEDEPDIREFLTDLLTDQGYAVETASDGEKGLLHAKEWHPDLILLDIQMPNETGVGMYRRMYRTSEIKETPVIVVSGMAGKNWAINARVPVIDKPIDERKLLDQIEGILN